MSSTAIELVQSPAKHGAGDLSRCRDILFAADDEIIPHCRVQSDSPEICDEFFEWFVNFQSAVRSYSALRSGIPADLTMEYKADQPFSRLINLLSFTYILFGFGI